MVVDYIKKRSSALRKTKSGSQPINLSPYVHSLLERFKEAYYFWTLIHAVAVNQVGCSVWAVDFVAFCGFFEADAAFFEHGAAVAVS